MNRNQIVRQVQSLLRAATWADTTVAFAEDSVLVTLGVPEKAAVEKRLPLVLIRPGAENADPDLGEQPGLCRIEVVVTVIVANAQDQFGETSLIGAGRDTGSTGRGLLEVEELVKEALLQKGAETGMNVIFRSSSTQEPIPHASLGYVVVGNYRFEAIGTVDRTYQTPSGFAATGGVGQVALSWNASRRFDARRFILRRASGATAPASATDGTGVTLGGTPDGSGVTSVTDTPLAAGTYSYALFLAYDDVLGDADEEISAAQTVTSVSVT